jgi:hypothetical protein
VNFGSYSEGLAGLENGVLSVRVWTAVSAKNAVWIFFCRDAIFLNAAIELFQRS